MKIKRLEFSDGKSNKFWEITLDGVKHTVIFGKINTPGQTQLKEFDSEPEALKAYEKLLQEKLKKGYAEVSSKETEPSSVTENQTPVAKPTSKTKAKNVSDTSQSTQMVEIPSQSTTKVSFSSETEKNLIVENSEVTRKLNIRPEDYHLAPWRNAPSIKAPAPVAFNIQAAIKKIEKNSNFNYSYHSVYWHLIKLEPFISRQEAHFWFQAMSLDINLKSGADSNTFFSKLSSEKLTGEIDLKMIEELWVAINRWYCIPMFVTLFATVSTPEEFMEMCLSSNKIEPPGNFMFYYHLNYWHTLSDEFKETLRKKVLSLWDPNLWPTQNYHTTPPAFFFLAAYLGMQELLLPLIESWPDNFYTKEDWADCYHRPQTIIFGLRDPKLVEHHMNRLSLRLRVGNDDNNILYLKAWLAHTEYSSFDWVTKSILNITNKDTAELFVQNLLQLINAPEVAPVMLELMLYSKAPRPAREWLDNNPINSIAGLLKTATGRGRLAEAAVKFLRTLKRQGYQDTITKFAALESKEVADKIKALIIDYEEKQYIPFDEKTSPDWLTKANNELKKSKSKPWVQVDALPPIYIKDNQFNKEQVNSLLTALQQSNLSNPHSFVSTVKANVEASVLDNFVWSLFEQWLGDGAVSKENWAMIALGLLGSNMSVLKLTPLVKVWPGENQHQRAVLGLQCLRAIGSDTALMQINGIAQKLKFKGLKEKATLFVEEIAKDKGLTRAELEDRIVPDCDLDEKGSKIFDFGSRQFRLVLSHDMKVMAKDQDNKVKSDLPKPNTKDDAEKASKAIEEWKLLKKQVSEVAKIQPIRLEQAMISGRRWHKSEFEMFLVYHPLMINLAKLLIFGTYDEKGKLLNTFRVTEDQSYANSSDESFELNNDSIGIVHPMTLAEKEAASWGEVFSDYEIIQPFPQLGRPILHLEPSEKQLKEITRFGKTKIAAPTFVSTLEKLGWLRGYAEDGGVFHFHRKVFYSAQVTAFVRYYGVPMGYMVDWDDQSVDDCFFLKGVQEDYYKYRSNNIDSMVLEDVDPIVISEVLNDLTTLISKGRQ